MSQGAAPTPGPGKARLRADKWLWQARFFKTRSLAAGVAGGGHLRVNGAKVAKAAHAVGPGDVLTFPQGNRIRVIRVEALGVRRGPAPEAQTLYTDLEPAPARDSEDIVASAPRPEGQGRPTKRDRRKLDLDRRRALE